MHQITDIHTEPQSSHSPHHTTNIYCSWMPVQKSLAWTMEPIRISKILWWLEFPPVAIRFAGYNCMGQFTTLTCSGILFISLPLSESDNQTSCLSLCVLYDLKKFYQRFRFISKTFSAQMNHFPGALSDDILSISSTNSPANESPVFWPPVTNQRAGDKIWRRFAEVRVFCPDFATWFANTKSLYSRAVVSRPIYPVVWIWILMTKLSLHLERIQLFRLCCSFCTSGAVQQLRNHFYQVEN